MPKTYKKNQRPLFVRMTREERTRLQTAQEKKGFRTIAEFVRQTMLVHSDAINAE